MTRCVRWLSSVAILLVGCGPEGGPAHTYEAAGAAADFAPRGDLSIFAIDVGNGDATLILGPEDRRGRRVSMLVDAGKLRADGGRIVNAVLDGAGVGRLDYVVATHYDADHIGGFVNVLGSDSVLWADADCTPGPHAPRRAIVDLGDWPVTSRAIEQWLDCVAVSERRGVEHVVVRDGAELGRDLDLGGGYVATVVAGGGHVIDREGRVPYVNTPNEHSIALWVHGPGGFDFLVTGDLIGRRHGSENARVEPALGQALAARGVDLEVLRLGHNGADNATSPELLAAVRPEVAVISVSAQNHFGHPGCTTYASLADSTVELVVQTQAGATACPAADRLGPEIADGTIALFVRDGAYEVLSVGERSGATDRETRPFRYACSVARGCAPSGVGGAAVTPAPGDLVFTEIMTNPDARTDARGEWFELTPAGSAAAYDLSGCWLRDDGADAVTLPDGLQIRGDRPAAFARTSEAGFAAHHVYGGGLTLANTEDELELVCAGRIVDRVAWRRGFPLRAGAAMQLDPARFASRANDDPSAWCLATGVYAEDRGSPGLVNPDCN